MRILWATPMDKRSAIALFSRAVCSELAERGHEVLIRRIEADEFAYTEPLPISLPVLGPDDYSHGFNADLTVLNLGNYTPYHARMLDVVCPHLPFMIFHDAEMRDFAWGAHHQLGLDLNAIARNQATERSETNIIVTKEASAHLALYASLSCGAVVHGPHYYDIVESSSPGPTSTIPLCFPDIGTLPRRPRPTSAVPRITIFGTINPNKQVDRVIEALGRIRLMFDCQLRLIGPYHQDEHQRLTRLADDVGILPICWTGYVNDDQLRQHLADTDVACCLRFPITEGGSASVATALYSGNPTIVVNAASYSLIPDECVSKVPYGTDSRSLANAIGRLLSEPEFAARQGAAGRAWAIQAYSAESYVNRLEPLLQTALDNLPWLRAVRKLSPAIPQLHSSVAVELLARAVTDLSGD